jgi:diketogulonate reductase-like aldo/keto reductase
MEAIHDSGRARMLGVSNIGIEQLRLLCEEARIRPRFVQNRCYAIRGWDRGVREFCAANGIVYQGFSLLTANVDVLSLPEVGQIAAHHGRGIAQIAFRFALDVGMLPLTGTTNAAHMRSDLDIFDFHLEADEVKLIENLATNR